MKNSTTPPAKCQDFSDAPLSRACAHGLSDGTYLTAAVSSEERSTPTFKPVKKKKFNFKKHITEVRGVEIYASTLVVKRHSLLPHEHEHKRGEILNLSASSLARLAFIAYNTPAHFPSMLTLTYPDEFSNDGGQVKRDLDTLLKWYRRNYPGELYLWWLEFQRRGAPHFHILSTVDLSKCGQLSTHYRKDENGKRTIPWETHDKAWQAMMERWVPLTGGVASAWEVIRDQEGGKKYAAAYATKAYQKAVPEAYRNVGRFWGHSRNGVKPEPTAFYECNEAQLREALKHGGWDYLPDDGEFLYRELYQAASKIDLQTLKRVQNLDPVRYPKREVKQSVYCCTDCGQSFTKWAGQCPVCEQWHTLALQEQGAVKPRGCAPDGWRPHHRALTERKETCPPQAG